ncbi:hypothetical protein HanXRQr2_Chr12g0564631 [Helianthus annuus]|uniref:Secreted protein n=2 Tax=Helianthus annuus TaxID=4232 RepID=A0A9K3HKM9_HELAN|nr:hypothetical protein HanXRQr2_Chr12g0564631 [Helianthus annuus]KAJ0491120.1 hypothetical protein HanHA300_Chr12g0463291 [Helianthus annuus]KAJ0495533.1 hypothetical protein HanIR_Chr12g0609841 [Helianthus annuus]KAJ0507040.1 hypothetical protein HanHA89_Chr12g0488771 [Helianthus annuus]KAJ0676669.1 hypothetical protein HanLR1_Chr12g0465341 [Helianthus annuus]
MISLLVLMHKHLGRWVWGSSPLAVLDQSPVAPPPCSVQIRCPGSSVQIPTVATSHSPTHTPLHTYIYIYKGVHPPPPRFIPFRTIPRGGDVTDDPFGTIPGGLTRHGH